MEGHFFKFALNKIPRSYFIENEREIKEEWLKHTDHIGICGATSTPNWLMEQVSNYLLR